MSIAFSFLAILAGFILLVVGGDKLVDGAVSMARRWKLSEVFIGIAIIGFGTSLPEVMSTLAAAQLGKDALVLGNIIGSNIANIGLIIAMALLLAHKSQGIRLHRIDYALMMFAQLLFTYLLLLSGTITALWGATLLIGLSLYLFVSLKFSQNETIQIKIEPKIEPKIEENMSSLKLATYIIGGLVALAVGAEFLIHGASTIARTMGVSERIIGLTLVAVGSSLPELAAAYAAIKKGNIAITFGNVFGSNTFNVLAAGGIGAIFTPLHLGAFQTDLMVMLFFSLALTPVFIWRPFPFKTWGFVLLTTYIGYLYIISN